jgi:hypothetical protein
MSIERLDPSRLAGITGEDVAAFIESDFKIRSGLCPNGHGLMTETTYGQECPTCGFFCNTPAEKGNPS